MTQAQLILAALKSGRSLTPIEALNDFGCFRLAARIYDLRAEGHPIREESVELPNGKHVARYSYDPAPPVPGQVSLW